MPVLNTPWGQQLLSEPVTNIEQGKAMRLANKKAQKELDYYDKEMELEERKVASRENENTIQMMEHWRKARADADDRTKQDMDVAETMAAVGLIARDQALAETGDPELAQAAADKAIQPFLQFISDPEKYGPDLTTFGPEDEHLGKGSLAYSRLLDAESDSVNFFFPGEKDPKRKIRSFAKSDIAGIENARKSGFEFSGTSGLQLTGGDLSPLTKSDLSGEVQSVMDATAVSTMGKRLIDQVALAPKGSMGIVGRGVQAANSAAKQVASVFDILDPGSGDYTLESYRQSLEDGGLDSNKFEELGIYSAELRSNYSAIAYMDAKAMEPHGRGLSDNDKAEAALRTIGEFTGDKKQVIGALRQTMMRVSSQIIARIGAMPESQRANAGINLQPWQEMYNYYSTNTVDDLIADATRRSISVDGSLISEMSMEQLLELDPAALTPAQGKAASARFNELDSGN